MICGLVYILRQCTSVPCTRHRPIPLTSHSNIQGNLKTSNQVKENIYLCLFASHKCLSPLPDTYQVSIKTHSNTYHNLVMFHKGSTTFHLSPRIKFVQFHPVHETQLLVQLCKYKSPFTPCPVISWSINCTLVHIRYPHFYIAFTNTS